MLLQVCSVLSQLTVCVIVVFLHRDVNKCDLYRFLQEFLFVFKFEWKSKNNWQFWVEW